MSSRPNPAARRSRKPLAAIVAIVIALGAGGWYVTQRNADAQAGTWRTVEVEQGDIRVAISATGTLSAISTVVVGSQISGQVTEVLVDFNDKVEQGQVLAKIDPSSYQAQIEQGSAQIASARASLAQAQASLRNAELDHRRKAELGARQLVSRSDIDLARAALDQARAQVASAQAQIGQQTAATQTTRINLGRTVIRSPVDGIVLTRTIEPGQTVAASLQAPELFTIAEDLSKMKIELAVDEADIGQVQAGQRVSFTADAFADRQFSGVVDQVRLSATNTSNVVTYPVVVTVDNSDGTLLPGLTVNAEIEVSRRDGVLKVSNAALRYKPTSSEGAASATPQRGAGAGMADDLRREAAALSLSAAQQSAFDEAIAAVQARQQARAAAPRTGGPGGGPGFGPSGGGAPSAGMASQLRQRMLQRYREDFSAFRASLDDDQARRWDAAMANLVGATRATVYRLAGGQPEAVMVRVGATDGTTTEISGGVQAGDVLVTGERAAR
ncbi:efflux RND transporter periplasmic adaptor subunit [Luteimonas sp. MC1750]|uniref:efflux RND transporter periplasmic adaptor subunit n=1 Tax=Luteimonas sp. MC1750 TaxID=2799326 RepID=UPI0018F0CC2A|nr:efflux RND transporter periplasmic adaptor subunit [Luteimonas sp. MC1750]MBJ6985389.1 efflux RND transporter periplasmic adaptor subunit [Luteimonas sp. MC1750]QQO05352.1 efflux RND transporter periplasmic adaptor subunit [Luteimonas sp. MC1750]